MTADLLLFGLDDVTRARLLAELRDLETEIADHESRFGLSVERLASFRIKWHEELGELLVQCGLLRAQVAAAIAARRPDDEEAATRASDEHDRALHAEAEWQATGEVGTGKPPDPEVKALYREAAHRFHPDLATDEEEREWRTEVMARVNAAYAERDADTLRDILASPDRTPEAEPTSTDQQLPAAVATRWRKLDDLTRATAALEDSDYWLLLVRSEQLEAEGRSLVEETRIELETELRVLREELSQLTGLQ